MSDWLDNLINAGGDVSYGEEYYPTTTPSYGEEYYPTAATSSGASYQDEGTWPASAAKAAATEAAGGATPSFKSFTDWLKSTGAVGSGAGSLLDMLGAKGSLAGLMALLSAIDRQKATGGGTAKAYAGPGTIPQRTIVQGKYGPIAKYAAEGGLMHAYSGGGKVQMEDGGFVMTKKAVDGAGGPDGIRQLIPGARMIRGPGTGTSDSIPAVINSPRGQTPAALSNGEAYINKDLVQRLGGAKRMYDMMHKLQRKA